MAKHLGRLIKNINDKIKVRADADLKQHGLTLAQSRVLRFLSYSGGTSTQKEIERFLDTSHPTVVGIISRMERGGYLACEKDKNDKRNKIVALTEKARMINKKICEQIEKYENEMTRGLSDEDIELFEKILGVIYKNLEGMSEGEQK